jgi:hypothetical protein
MGLPHPLCGTYLSHKSQKVRGHAANRYGKSKRTGYEKEIEEKSLNYLYRSFTVETACLLGTGESLTNGHFWRRLRNLQNKNPAAADSGSRIRNVPAENCHGRKIPPKIATRKQPRP